MRSRAIGLLFVMEPDREDVLETCDWGESPPLLLSLLKAFFVRATIPVGGLK